MKTTKTAIKAKKPTAKKMSSNSKKAQGIIRREMLSYFHAREYGTKTNLQAMKKRAESYNGGELKNKRVSDYRKGSALVDAGSLACYKID